ncbi:MAG: ABC transporter substrate-binding protein [Phascolarctobacterium sp.]|uniref:ABC transporter substrate-binding protein n=1 Tax=Phascolarctobacterium sp. TaxID=2049039 RepID=UPI0026DAA8E3|nr:ABC transporter substrate-binding protein [Phascolarctobacterium sp.]MDO4922324.1 ABC transporter substrate-binding protein [Phascolarctobacterium sp.]
MKFSWKFTAAAAMAALLALATAGCGSKTEEAKSNAAAGKTLKLGVVSFADNLEPTNHAIGWTLTRYGLGETLIKFDKKMNVTPWIAESWSVSDDKLTWTFKINDKAKFSNGNKVTAEACMASIQRTIDKSIEAKSWANIVSMKAEGQNLMVTTSKPMPGLPGVFGDPYFVIIDTSVKDRDIMRMGPICTGPYTIVSFNQNKSVMKANSNYWDGPVPYDNVEIPSVNDPTTRAMALQKGEIDAAVNIAYGDMALFRDKKGYRVSEMASIRDCLARMNVNEGKPLADLRVRQALLASIDRETYCQSLLHNTYVAGGPAMPPTLDFGYNELTDPNSYNVERAKKLLAEAGWRDSDGDGYVDKDGKNLELTYVIYTSRAELPIFAEATQADAKKAGIKIDINAVDYNVLDGIGTSGKYDLLISNILATQAGSPINFMNMYWRSNINGSNPQNSSGYSNPAYDALGDAYLSEFDSAKRRQIIIDMQKILLNDAVTIIYGYPQTNIVSSDKVANADIQACDFYWLTKDWQPVK